MSKYYDWNKTLAYDADVTIVVGARGIGKTYAMNEYNRKYAMNEYNRNIDDREKILDLDKEGNILRE